MKRTTVLLADDCMLIREALRAILASEEDIDVVAEAETGRQAVHLTRLLLPDVVVMDIAMPVLNGLEAIRQIHESVPAAKVLILSAHSDQAYVEQAARLGAAGYLTKQTSAETLARTIRAVTQGREVFGPALSRSRPKRSKRSRTEENPSIKRVADLRTREVEVIQLIAEGKANKQAAAELGLHIKTVEKHRHRLMRKLNIHDTAGLTRYAVAAGIIEVHAVNL